MVHFVEIFSNSVYTLFISSPVELLNKFHLNKLKFEVNWTVFPKAKMRIMKKKVCKNHTAIQKNIAQVFLKVLIMKKLVDSFLL